MDHVKVYRNHRAEQLTKRLASVKSLPKTKMARAFKRAVAVKRWGRDAAKELEL